MKFNIISIMNGIKEAVDKGVNTAEKIANVLNIKHPLVKNFFNIILPAISPSLPSLIGIYLTYSFFQMFKKENKPIPKDLKELEGLFKEFYNEFMKKWDEWDEYIKASGVEPLTRIMMKINPEKAEEDKKRFLIGFKPTWNVIQQNVDIERDVYEEIKRKIKEEGKNIIILGDSGSGKTTLMMRLAYDLMKEGWHSFIGIGKIDTQKALTFLDEPEFANEKRIVFIDDVATRREETLNLVREIYTQGKEIIIVLVEQTARWQLKVKENLATYNFEKFKITLKDNEAKRYIQKYNGREEYIKVAGGIFPILVLLVSKRSESFEKAVDDFWNSLDEKEKQLMIPVLILSSYGVNYPYSIFEKVYPDSITILSNICDKEILSMEDDWLKTWHPLISKKIIEDRLKLRPEAILNHINHFIDNVPKENKYESFLFSLATEILIEQELSKPIKEINKKFIDVGIKILNKVIELNPASAEAYNNRGLAYDAKGEYDKAIEDYTKAIEINRDLAEAYNNRGLAYAHKGEYDKAIADYTKALGINPVYAGAYNNRGLAYAAKGEYDKAIADYTKAIGINPDLAEAYNNRGNAYAAKGEYEKAIEDYTKAIEINPDLAEVYNNRGNAYYSKGEYEKAIADYTKAIGINRDLAEAYNNRGVAYYKKGEYEKAIADYTKAIEINPDLAGAYYNRGIAYMKKGDYDEAIKDFTEVIKLNPEDVQAMVYLGDCYKNKGEREKAREWYLKALEKKEKLPNEEQERLLKYLNELNK